MSLPNTLSYIFWNIRPEIVPGIDRIRWYGLCWAVGLLLAYLVMQFIYKREKLPPADLDRLTLYLVTGIVVGARVAHIVFYDPVHYWNNPIEILPVRLKPHFEFVGLAGLASHGGVAGALVSLFLYTRKYGNDYLRALDRLTIAAALLGGFIRLGNLMNSEIIGTPSSVPWAFVFTHIDQLPRHPAQLYEAAFYFLIFALLFTCWRSNRFNQSTGFLFGLGLSLIFTLRFIVEYVKENQEDFENGLLLNMGQILSIPFIVAGLIVVALSLSRRRPSVA